MDLSLEQCLQYLLYRDRKLILPGVGVLVVNRAPAKFSADRSTLLPPQFSVDFNEQLTDTHSLIPDQYHQEYAQKIHLLNDAMLTEGKADLLGFGQLVHQDNTVKFHPNNILINKIFGGLQPIEPIEEVKRVYQPEVTFSEPMTLIDRKNDKSWLPQVLKWLLGLGFVAVLVYLLMFFPWPSGDDGTGHAATVNADTAVEKVESPVSDTNSLTGDSNLEKSTSSDTLTKASESIENEKEEYIIITGSFKQKKYIDRMQKRLRNNGYVVFLGDNDSTTRVGVRIQCSADELADHLSRIRARFSKEAWVLTD